MQTELNKFCHKLEIKCLPKNLSIHNTSIVLYSENEALCIIVTCVYYFLLMSQSLAGAFIELSSMTVTPHLISSSSRIQIVM